MPKNTAPVAVASDSDIMTADESAALRAEMLAEAQAAIDAANAPAPAVTDAPAVTVAAKYTMPVNPNSIRQIVRTMLLGGSDTKTIAAVLLDRFPTSAAAAKSVKHIAYYRAQLKKEAARA